MAKRVILLGGTLVAVFDIAFAIGFWALRGVAPAMILQSVAAGVLGPAAFSGGAATAALGAALHWAIALVIAAVYWYATTRAPQLLRRPAIGGIAYGLVVYVVMNYLVVPLSLARTGAFDPAWFTAAVFAHVALVGLPLAYLARWSARHQI